MWNRLYRKITLLFLILLNIANASHLQGFEVSYECIGNNIYRIYITVYRDCAGIPASPPSLQWSPAGCVAPNQLTPWQDSLIPNPCGSPANPIISPQVLCDEWLCDSTTCSGGRYPGTNVYIWYADFDFSSSTCFQLSITSCCRPTGISNLQNSGSQGMCSQVTINPALCNHPPQFTGFFATPTVCVGAVNVFNPNIVDPDGDSLVFSLTNCLDDNCSSVTYAAGYSPTNPFNSAVPPIIDPQTGIVIFTVDNFYDTLGTYDAYQFCYQIEEYRNGVLIGTYVRDLTVLAIQCPANALPDIELFEPDGTPLAWTSPFLYRDTLCFGDTFHVKMDVKDPLTDVKLDYSLSPAMKNVTFSPPSGYVPAILGQDFIWIADTIPATGFVTATFNVKDKACPIAGEATYTFQLFIKPRPQIDLTFNINCNDVQLNASITNANPPYIAQWTGGGGINQNPNNTQLSFTHTYPAPGTYPISFEVITPESCRERKDTIVNVPNTAVILDAGWDRTTCSGTTDTLGTTSIPGQTYSWTPTNGLSNPASPRPELFATTTNAYFPDTLTYYLNVSNGICSAKDSVKVVVYPIPQAYITGPTKICRGDVAALSGPDYSFGYGYFWSTGDTSRTIYVMPSKTTTYTLYTTSGPCVSQPSYWTVIVDTIPDIEIFGPREICLGHTATYVGLGAQTYQWNNGSSSSTTTYTISQDSFHIVLIGQSGVCPPDTEEIYVRAFNAPMVEIQPLTPIQQCFIGNQFQLTTSLLPGSAIPTSYLWFLGEQAVPAVVETQTTPFFTFKTPGEKHVWLVAKNNVCPSDTARITLYVIPHPEADFEVPSPQCWYQNSYDFVNTTTPLYSGMQFIWRFGPNAVPTTSNDVNPSGVFFIQPGTFPVELVAIDTSGCRDSITKEIIVYQHPDTPIVEGNEICQGFNTILHVTHPQNETIYWYASETDTIPLGSGYNFFTPHLNQTTTYWVASQNQFGCQSLARTPVTVVVHPLPPLAIDPDTGQILLEIPNTTVQFTTITDPSVVAYEWNFGDGSTSTLPNPTHQYEKPGLYTVTLTVVDTNGCVSTLVRKYFVKVEEPIRIFIPTAFSPNGDGLNDEFYIVTNLVDRIQLQIFDRWGNVIYETNDLNFRWDGYDYLRGEPCPEGVYTYYLKVVLYDGRKLERHGSITLIR